MNIDTYLTKVVNGIAKHGLMIQGVFPVAPTDKPFAYTIGLHPKYGYEAMIVGLDVDLASRFLNSYAADIAPIYKPADGTLVDIGSSHLFQLRQMGPDHRASIARSLYGDALDCWQLVWPDVHDVHPGAARSAQTLPGSRLDGR